MFVGTVVLVVVAVAWLHFLWSRRKFYRCALQLKGPWGLPFVGIVHQVYRFGGLIKLYRHYAEYYKTKTYFTWLGPFPIIYTSDLNVADALLLSSDCLNKSMAYDAIEDGIGNGLVTSKTPKWNKHRKLISPCFGHKVLLEKISQFNEHARDLCGQLETQVGCGEIDLKEILLKVILKASADITMDTHVKEDSKILESFESISGFILDRISGPCLKSMTLYSWSSAYKPFVEARSGIRNFIGDITKSKLQDLGEDSNQDPSHVFIERAISIHKRNEFTIDDIIDETTFMVLAGYETTGSTLYSTLMFLAMHPEFQERAFNEISSLYHSKEFDVTFDDFKSLVYLEMCVNETLRLTVPVPIIGRKCERDVRISEDITLPAGTEAYFDIFCIHRDEDIWGPTAKTYNPDRFLPNNLNGRQKGAFLPFSKGKRNCLGRQYAEMFLKVMLAQILRNFKFSTTSRFEDIGFEPLISLKYMTTPRLSVQRR